MTGTINHKTKQLLCFAAFLFIIGFVILICGIIESRTKQQACIDVQEEDGRFVIWKENAYFHPKGDLIFSCRNGTITGVMISRDGGRHYIDETDAFQKDPLHKRIIIPKKHLSASPICVKFTTEDFYHTKETRNYRIFYQDDEIISDFSDRDSFFATKNMIN